jgi:hypothetical protein
MTMMRVVKNMDYDYIYIAQVKYWWCPFWISVKSGLKEKMIEYVQACVSEGKVVSNPVVYSTAIN